MTEPTSKRGAIRTENARAFLLSDFTTKLPTIECFTTIKAKLKILTKFRCSGLV